MEPDRFKDPFLYPLFANLTAIAVPITVRPACSMNGFDKDSVISPLCLPGDEKDLLVTLRVSASAAKRPCRVGILANGGRNARHELVTKSANTTSNLVL